MKDRPLTFAVNPERLPVNCTLEHIFNFTLTSPEATKAKHDASILIYHRILDDGEAAGVSALQDVDADTLFVHSLLRALVRPRNRIV